MAIDVFISHSSVDKITADMICAILESKGIRCWIAPRDIRPGEDWPEAIMNALQECHVVVLVFSKHANESPMIKREITSALNRGVPIIPFRIENIMPTGTIEFSIGTAHWLDAYSPPLEAHIAYLADCVLVHLKGHGIEPAPVPFTPPPVEPPPPRVSPPLPKPSPKASPIQEPPPLPKKSTPVDDMTEEAQKFFGRFLDD